MTIEDARRYFDYDQSTGIMRWKEKLSKYSRIKPGDIVGYKNSQGYLQLGFAGKTYKVHRTAWMVFYGEVPEVIDHINGNKTDNRISNLRSVDNRTNNQNKIHNRNGKLLGCHFRKDRNLWRAEIRINGENIRLGHYTTEREAHEAYKKAHREMVGRDL